MSDLERRLREGRPPVIEPSADTEARLMMTVLGPNPRRLRSPETWRRGLPRTRGGRLLGVAVLLLGAATAAAIAAGVLDRGPAPRAATAAVAAPSDWGPPVLLDAGIRRVPRPEVAMDNVGATMVAWSPGGFVNAAYRPRGGAWTRPARLSPAGVSTGDPALALARDGRSALVVWRERRGVDVERRVLRLPDGSLAGVIQRRVGGEYVLVARRWRAGAGWSAPADVSEPGGNQRDMSRPRAVVTDGGFLIAWTRGDALEARTVSSGGDLGAVDRIATVASGEPIEPFLAARGPQDAVLAWAVRVSSPDPAGFSAPTYSIEASTREGSGWTAARVIADDSVGNPRPAAALSSGGDSVVVWIESRARIAARIAASRRPARGDWETRIMLSASGRSAFGPNVAIDGDGRIVAHWSVGATTQFSSAGLQGTWSRPVGRGDAGLIAQFSRTVPALADDGAGRLVGVFGKRTGAEVRDWPPGGPFGDPSRALGETGWQYGVAGLAASPSGSAALVVVGFGRKGSGEKGWNVRVAVRERVDQSGDEGGR